MTYYNTPLSNQTPAASQPQMQQNFLQIATSYNTDHVALDQPTNAGQHKQVSLANVLAGDPGHVAPNASVYTKAFAGNPQLFFQNGALAANVVQLTGSVVSGINSQGLAEYSISTPFGLIFKFGSGKAITAGTLNNFAVQFPAAVLGVVASVAVPGFFSPVAVTLNSPTGFTAYTQAGGAQGIFYFAWGN